MSLSTIISLNHQGIAFLRTRRSHEALGCFTGALQVMQSELDHQCADDATKPDTAESSHPSLILVDILLDGDSNIGDSPFAFYDRVFDIVVVDAAQSRAAPWSTTKTENQVVTACLLYNLAILFQRREATVVGHCPNDRLLDKALTFYETICLLLPAVAVVPPELRQLLCGVLNNMGHLYGDLMDYARSQRCFECLEQTLGFGVRSEEVFSWNILLSHEQVVFRAAPCA